jgi:hypothetical protein
MMKRSLAATVMALSVQLTHAAVVPLDPNDVGASAAFVDSRTGLMWTNANAFAPAYFEAAHQAVANSSIAGFRDWRLPTMSEFLSLYQTQFDGDLEDATAMPLTPFTRNANWYTTTDVYPQNAAQNYAFGPDNSAADQNQVYFRTTTVGVWAVRLDDVSTPVPEPTTLVLMLTGMLALVASREKVPRRPA